MGCNIFKASGNELFALAVSFSTYLGNIYSVEELAILSVFFNLVGDSLALYATANTNNLTKTPGNTSSCKN